MMGQIPARGRSATSFGPVCDQDSVVEFGFYYNNSSDNDNNTTTLVTWLYRVTLLCPVENVLNNI